MELTRKLDDKFSNISGFLHENIGELRIGKFIAYPFVLILVIIYIIILYSELLLCLLMYRHGVKAKTGEWGESLIDDKQREWLNKYVGKGHWKSMSLDYSASEWFPESWVREEEIRFLTKKSAVAYKMVWG